MGARVESFGKPSSTLTFASKSEVFQRSSEDQLAHRRTPPGVESSGPCCGRRPEVEVTVCESLGWGWRREALRCGSSFGIAASADPSADWYSVAYSGYDRSTRWGVVLLVGGVLGTPIIHPTRISAAAVEMSGL